MATCNTKSLITRIPETQCVGDSLSTINLNFENIIDEIYELNYLLPAGSMIMWAGIGSPSADWLICDGSYHDKNVYPELYKALGALHGAIDDDRFRVPDMRGRVPIGVNSSNISLTARYVGQFGGSESIGLSASQMPVHTHLITDTGHTHSVTQAAHTHNVSISNHTHSISDRGHTHNVYAGYIAGSNYMPGSTVLGEFVLDTNETGAPTTAHQFGVLYALAPTTLFTHLHAYGAYTSGGGLNSTSYRLDSHTTVNGLSGSTGVPLLSGSGDTDNTGFWIVPEVGTTKETQLQITIASTRKMGLFSGADIQSTTYTANGISIDPTPLTATLSSSTPSMTATDATTNISINNAGLGKRHSNLQPFTVINYIIKATGCRAGTYAIPGAPPANPNENETDNIPTPTTVPTPTITPNGYTGLGSVQVTLGFLSGDVTAAAGAIIHYTTNGSDPTARDPVYVGAFRLSSNTIVKAKASRSGSYDSGIATAEFFITPAVNVVAAPVLTPAGGSYSPEVTVSIACETSGAEIYYTLGSMDPTTNSSLYNQPFVISNTTQIKARAFKFSYNDSPITVGDFTIYAQDPGRVAKPVITPTPGAYNDHAEIFITCATPNSIIYYTTNGSEPTNMSNVYLDSSFTITSSCHVKAIALRSDLLGSEVADNEYTIANSTNKVATPIIISPSGGSFNTSVTAYITCATPQSVIYYTLSTGAYNQLYNPSTGIVVSSTTTITARAQRIGWTTSDPAVATLTLSTVTTVATPTIAPPSGNFTASIPVTIACTTAGATIYYTTNGTTPSSASIVYNSQFTIDISSNVKAIAILTSNSSSVASADYNITRTPATDTAQTIRGYVSASGIINVNSTSQYKEGTIYSTVLGGFGPQQQSLKWSLEHDKDASGNPLVWDSITRANAQSIISMLGTVYNATTGRNSDYNPTYWGGPTVLAFSGSGSIFISGQRWDWATDILVEGGLPISSEATATITGPFSV